jgi:adenylosuccinate synthase
MPVSVVVGGQYGSEGKGKVAQALASSQGARAVVRVGGSNSGHTTMGPAGQVLRQLPTAAVLPDVLCVLPAGSYIDVPILLQEVARLNLSPERLVVDPNAMIISDADRLEEEQSDLRRRIGSTCSGTGAAVVRRAMRGSAGILADACPPLAPYVSPSVDVLRRLLDEGERVVIEGTQGFGLSLLHTPHFPKATSRDTSAAGALSEAGLSPLDVDHVALVLRAHPIRVAGDSGPFGGEEIDWETLAAEGGLDSVVEERTSVTGLVRRVSRFDAGIVRDAIAVNQPTMIVLNHVDYVDFKVRSGELTAHAHEFVAQVAADIGRPVDFLGLGPDVLVSCRTTRALVA